MTCRRLPDWLKVRLPGGEKYKKVKEVVELNNLHTVCESAKCPNIGECWGCGTATFMILGESCTRKCAYCGVPCIAPTEFNEDEAKRVADAVGKLGIKYAVITSVTRDDLEDGGASVFFDTVNEIKKINPNIKVELLIPDFKGNFDAVKKVIESRPDVIGHNIEVVKELFSKLRPNGDYETSLKLLKKIKSSKIITKSGFMLGFGETKEQIIETLHDLKNAGVDIVTIGQYLQPSKQNTEVVKFYSPAEFDEIKKTACSMGFKHVEAGPLVRSSYHTANYINKTFI